MKLPGNASAAGVAAGAEREACGRAPAGYGRLRLGSARTDRDTVRRFLLVLTLVLVVVGCGETGVYDEQAKELALREAAPGPFNRG